MKKLILLALLALMGGVSYAQTSIQGRQVDVRAFGAKCDGTTNDQTAIAAAITAVTSTGGVVNLPDGTCVVSGTLTISGGVTLQGKGKSTTIIKGSVNAPILDLVQGSGMYAFRGPTIRNLTVQGSSSGSSQIGINIDDALYFLDVTVEHVAVTLTGSHGVYFGNVFSSQFNDITSGSSSSGYPFLFNQLNMPGNTFRSLYAADVNSTSPSGFRIRTGNITCWGCNGINSSSSNSWWATVGDKVGTDGALTNRAAYLHCIDCNIESSKAGGIQHYYNSRTDLDGLTLFSGDASASGTYIALKYEVDNAVFPPYFQKGVLSPSTTFANSPLAYYSNSQVIHANDLPPVSIEGAVRQADGNIINTYYNTTNSRAEAVYRVDGAMPVLTITSSTSYTYPGATNYEANCASNCTLTLPWPGWYTTNTSPIYIRNIGAGTLTINSGGGGTMNGGGSYTLVTGESVQFMPHTASADYRLVGMGGSGASTRIPYFDGTQHVTSSANLTYDGTTVLNQRAGGNPYFAANDTTNSITTRFGPLAGAPDRAIIGTSSNHPFGFWMNSAERWTINTSGDFTPGAASTYSIGSATLPVLNTTLNGKLFWNSTTVFDNYGSGSPEGVITAAVGSVYRRTNGAAGTTLYVKESGSGNTGWSAIATTASGVSSVNGLVGALTIATGTTGADFNVSASGTTVTLNLPDASASVRGAMTTGTQTFAGAKSFTSVGTFNPGTTPANAILIDINALGTAGTRDSNWLVLRGRSNDGATHLTEWKEFVDVTTNAGGSTWTLQSRIDAAAFGTLFTVSDAGAVTGGDFLGASFTTSGGAVLDDDINAVTGFTIAGAATSGQYLRGNGTRFVNSAIQAGDLPATVVLTTAANTYTAGQKQTFSPNGTTAGFNVGSVAGDPSSPSNGDCWYDSTANEFTCRINGSNVALGSGAGGTISGSGTSGKLAKFTGASSIGDSIVSESGSTLTVTGDAVPEADNTRKLGTSALRWSEVNVGPGSIHVRNDATNTLKMDLGFSSTVATLSTDAASPLQLKVGSTTGVYFNTSGKIGFGTTGTPDGDYDFRQLANNTALLNLRRFTDTTPLGALIQGQNAAGAVVYTVDVTGTMTVGTIPAARISSGTIAPANGGTGQDTSGSSGMPLITAGTWSVISTTGSGNAVRATSPTIAGGAITALTSLGIRSSGTGAFDLAFANTENLTAGRTLTITLNDAPRTLNLGGNLTTAAAFATSGANSLTLTTTGATNVTLPTTGTLATLAGAESLTNKKLGSLTTNGFVKTSGGDGTLSVDTNTYLTSNQTITLSGDVSGSGTTAITTTIGANKVTNAMLAGSITDDKLNQITTADKVADSALSTNVPLLNTTNTFTGGKQTITLTDSGTNTVADLLDLQHVGGTTTTSFGSGIRFGLETSNGSTNQQAANLNVQWTDATLATRTSKFEVQLANSGTVGTRLKLDGNGNLAITGTSAVVTATGFSGSGASLTALNGSNISTGTVSAARGGTGADTSASNGLPYLTSGSWGVVASGGTSSEWFPNSSGTLIAKRKTHNIFAYGAVCDGSTDDRTAVQAMFDAMVTGDKATFEGCKTIKIGSQTTIGNGSGTYGSTSSATASTVTDIEVDGANVTVTWTGSSGGPFKINGPIYRVTFQNFRIEMGGNAGIALDLNHTRLSVFRKLYINANADYGFRLRAYPVWTGGDGANGNTIESVWINTTTAGGKGFDIGDTDYCSGCSTHLDPAQNNFSNIRARFDTGVGTWLASSVGMRLNFTDAGVCTDCIFAAATAVSVNVPTGTNSYPSAYMFNNLSAQGTTSFSVTGTWTAVEKFGFYNYLTGDSQAVPTDSNTFGTTSKGITWGLALDTGYITGLQLTWNSTSQIQIGTGVAQIQSTGRLLNVSSALTINPSLGASTWYYCYVYDNSGTPAGECVTTAPASAWFGTARSKTSDTTRRYVGAIRTNGSSQLYVFYHNPQNGYVQWLEDTTASPFRAISAGTATTETSVDCTAVAPATARQIQLRTINTSTPTGNVFIRASTGGANVLTVRVNADLITPATVTTGQLFYYLYNVAPSGAFYGDVIGYFDNR